MVAGVTRIMVDGVILHMVGVTRHMAGVMVAGVILITDMVRTGQVTIVDTGMDITVVVDTITPPLITRILMVDGATGMVSVSPGQVIRDMEPGLLITVSRTMPDLPMEEAVEQVPVLRVQPQLPGQQLKATKRGV